MFAASVGLSACASLSDFLAPLGSEQPEEEVVSLAEQPRLDPLSRNHFVLESDAQTVVGEPQIVFTREEHTFSDLAREYGLGYDELVAANPDIDPWLPGAGTAVLLPTQYVFPDVPKRGIVLNIAAKRLFYFPDVSDGEQASVLTFPIGIGRVGWETPLGESEVIAKARDPHWYVPASVRKEHEELGDPLPAIVPPGPENPLGHRVLKLDLPGYLIHGTNQPYGVGMRVSHGCVRLYPENIEQLYELIPIGEPVVIVNEPYLLGRFGDGPGNEWLFEAHTPLEDDEVAAEDRLSAIQAQLEAGRPEGAAKGMVDEAQTDSLAAIAAEGLGVAQSLRNDNPFHARVRVVKNTVELDPDMPTLAEVRELLDTPVDAADNESAEDGEARAPANE